MKVYLSRRYGFPASHRLNCDTLSAQENRNIYGKCNNPYGHGHNYTVEVTFSGHIDPATGMVCDLGELDSFMNKNVVSVFDHMDLNHLPQFASVVPTTENLCREIYDIITKDFRAAKLERIRIEETRNNAFEYAGGAELMLR